MDYPKRRLCSWNSFKLVIYWLFPDISKTSGIPNVSPINPRKVESYEKSFLSVVLSTTIKVLKEDGNDWWIDGRGRRWGRVKGKTLSLSYKKFILIILLLLVIKFNSQKDLSIFILFPSYDEDNTRWKRIRDPYSNKYRKGNEISLGWRGGSKGI